MNSYQNQMGAFENSVEQSKSQLNNFTNRREEIVGDNKKLLSSAKALQSSDLIQNVVSNMSGLVGMKALKTMGGKGVTWLDKKLGGKIAKDTEGFKNIVKKKGEKLLKKAVGKVADKVKGEGGGDEADEGVELQDVSPESQVENSVKTTTVEDTGEMGTSEMKESGEATEEGEEKTYYEEEDAGDFKEVSRETKSNEEFGEGADEDVSNESKFENETKEVDAENDGIDKANEDDGADDDDEDDGEDAGEDVAEDAGEDVAVDEGVGDTLEGVGTAADATGIGAIIGVPLQIAGAITDIVGIVEAGKSFGDWFNEDVLGNKPPVKAQNIALPTAPSTLASKGFQATPSYSSAVEVGGGAGGW